ncbi:hypothetical protein JHK85_018717 [Glycine max]|nr:hypothetical protein JHK85_018717 [Glycine max]KAG5037477.1 hypothetical protein JHK86_018317 [Glycine max]
MADSDRLKAEPTLSCSLSLLTCSSLFCFGLFSSLKDPLIVWLLSEFIGKLQKSSSQVGQTNMGSDLDKPFFLGSREVSNVAHKVPTTQELDNGPLGTTVAYIEFHCSISDRQ